MVQNNQLGKLNGRPLAFRLPPGKLWLMKLLVVTLVHLLIVAVMAGGIMMLMAGKPALLIAGLVVYIIAFAKSVVSAH
jgi:hypothetical protein